MEDKKKSKYIKKVGIMTYFDFYNQGTMLQAYALEKKIIDYGYEAEIINYTLKDKNKPLFLKIKYKILHIFTYLKSTNKYFYNFINKEKIHLRNNKYKEFLKNKIKLSKNIYNSEEELRKSPPEYDIYMVGSDQTWNPYLQINSKAFYLDFVEDFEKKVTYAPSIGISNISEEKALEMKKYLVGIKHLSCRDYIGAELISKLVNRKVKKVLDPTLLINSNEWDKIIKKPNIKDEKYILCYFLGSNNTNIKFAEQLSKNVNIKIFYIYNDETVIDPKKSYLYDVGPSEFLYLIRNAEYVCTDSFHGTVFSIIYKKQFYSFTKKDDGEKSDNNRIYELLNEFKLKDRYINKSKIYDNINKRNEINYNEVYKILEEKKEESEKYLKSILK